VGFYSTEFFQKKLGQEKKITINDLNIQNSETNVVLE